MRAVVLNDWTHPRARRIGEALLEGAREMGWPVALVGLHDKPSADLVLSYGWKHRPTFDAYRAIGANYLYVDLGYWKRRAFRGDFGGLHKVVCNARHATKYFQRNRPADRLAEAPQIAPWQTGGRHILLAGLSGKGAQSVGERPFEWERRTIAHLQNLTDRPIIYRPKPSWRDARPIQGVRYSPPDQPLEDALAAAHAVVTHYSNVGLDALWAGIPVCVEDGLATAMATPLSQIETPQRPEGREQFLADVSYCQFSRAEIVSGMMFQQFLDDGLI